MFYFLESDEIFQYENLSETDKDRISRLFYLQLYSGTLDAEKFKEDENYKKLIKELYEKRKELEVDMNFCNSSKRFPTIFSRKEGFWFT